MRYNPSLKPLTLVGYEDQEGEFSMTNNGHTGKGGPQGPGHEWSAGKAGVGCRERHAQRLRAQPWSWRPQTCGRTGARP